MAVPYVLEFAAAGLTPVFTTFMRLDTRASVIGQAPVIYDAGGGAYVFYRDYDTAGLYDVYFKVDAGSQQVDRYRSGVIGPFDATDQYTRRALGRLGENVVIDEEVLDDAQRVTSARHRLYDTKANAELAGATGLIGTYRVFASYGQDGACTMVSTREA